MQANLGRKGFATTVAHGPSSSGALSAPPDPALSIVKSMNLAKRLVYGAARAAGLFALARLLTRHRVRILCFHGGALGDEHQFNPLLFCSGEHLAERLSWLRAKGFSWTSLPDAVDMLKGSLRRPHLPVVVTMDDGWHSTAAVLGPVIERHGVPAALYLGTGHFLRGQPVPEVSVSYLLWKLAGATVHVRGLDPALDGCHVLSDTLERRTLLIRAVQWVRQAPVADVSGRLEQLAAALGLDAKVLDLASRRFSYMDDEAVHTLRAQGWSIELHGHEHRYPIGDPDALERDLLQCQAAFADAGLPRGRHYCYPSGRHDDVARRVMPQHGVASATTCMPGLCPDGDTDALYYLPRFLDGASIPPVIFEAEMSGFADGVRWLARLARRLPCRFLGRGTRAASLSPGRT